MRAATRLLLVRCGRMLDSQPIYLVKCTRLYKARHKSRGRNGRVTPSWGAWGMQGGGVGTVLWGWFRDVRSFLADSSTSRTGEGGGKGYQVAPASVETATVVPLHSQRV